jgi:hypothetical protein
MKNIMALMIIVLLLLPIQIKAQTKNEAQEPQVDYPWVPRVSAYEAYTKYKEGKAIILHGGGESYRSRHIVGSINVDFKDREKLLLKFPQKGMEIFTYCY